MTTLEVGLRRALPLLLPLSLTLALACKKPTTAAARGLSPSPECFANLAGTLAADTMEGRGVGSLGIDRAAAWLTQRFQAAGLEPVGGAYEQTLTVTTGVALGAGNALQVKGGPALNVGQDFTPLGLSGSGSLSAPVTFVGYGIRATELGYDDYAGVDVKGRVALALRYEPGERDEKSPFDGKRATRWSEIRTKALLAREAGAVALVLVAPPVEPDEPDRLPVMRVDGPQSDAGIPVIQVTRAVAESWMKAGGQDLWALQAAIDADYKPRSAALSVELAGTIALEPTRAEVRNVVGLLPGEGVLAEEYVVVGAHYDHLGMGGPSSRAPDVSEIHNGADDNASGVAAMLCGVGGLRDTLGASTGERRSLLVIAFTAEEIGLGGSAWYVGNPLVPLEKTVAMVNLDMVGRVRDGKLSALGTDSAPEWKALLEPAATAAGLSLELGGDGYGPSDQMSFYTRGVPVVHLFSGAHAEYHTPQDDAALLNNEGGGQVARLLQGALDGLLKPEVKLTYAAPKAGPVMAGDSRGYGTWLGSIPDYTAMSGEGSNGVKLSGVRPGSPAEEAGVLAGDVLIGMDGVQIRNLYDMTFVLQDRKPGQMVELVVRRGDQEVKLRATLRARPATGSPHGGAGWRPSAGKDANHLLDSREKHLADLRQLTFGGENAEAYWSPDGKHIIFQRTPAGGGCDQQHLLDLTTGEVTLLSSGKGRTTCGYFSWPQGERMLYATTEGASPDCPPSPDMSQGYVWAIYPSYDIVWQRGPGQPTEPFLPNPGYDAEATACMKDGRVIFTSTRGGDLDLWSAKPDGSDLKQLTSTPGYDGGAYFSSDCQSIVWRASRPTGKALDDYKRLLKMDLVRPSALELYWANADGSNPRQLTNNGAANFGPYPLPGDKGAIFSSNMGANPREFDLWMVGLDGGEPERVTYTAEFDGFPMFSPDNQWLIFASNRGGQNRETNLFVARWVP